MDRTWGVIPIASLDTSKKDFIACNFGAGSSSCSFVTSLISDEEWLKENLLTKDHFTLSLSPKVVFVPQRKLSCI
jgi:hypothetical protein